jgi:hypothetical protein
MNADLNAGLNNPYLNDKFTPAVTIPLGPQAELDALKAEVERLKWEAQYVCESHAGEVRKGGPCCWCQLARLREAIVKFGRHLESCASVIGWGEHRPCDCGLAAIIKERP